MPQQAPLQSFSSLSVILSLYLGSESIVHDYNILQKLISEKPVKLKPFKGKSSEVKCAASYWRYQYKQFSLMHFLYSSISVHIPFHYFQQAGRKNMPKIHLCCPRVSEYTCSSSHRYNYSWQLRKLLYRQV